jgi:pimeloyl-ACP methyl ester carboxylesterase
LPHFSSDGIDIAYLDEGAGEPILLIHGFASNARVNWQSTGWIDTLLTAGFRVIAMDVRGHGDSAKLYEPRLYHPSLLAGDAANLLRHLGIGSAVVIGYSMGGRIAAFLAAAHPASVRALVIGGMGLGMVLGIGGEDEIAAALEADSLDAVTGERGRSYRKFADLTQSDCRALAACMRGQRVPVTPEALASLHLPVLVAVGTRDTVAGSAEGLAALIAGAEVLPIPNRDHMLATGDKAFKAGVLEFLARRLGPAANS